MTSVVEVQEIIERNNCAGKKDFQIIPVGEDNVLKTAFRLNHGWLPPYAKLELAAVAPMDKVRVVVTNQFFHQAPHVVGEYIENLSDVHTRDSLCRCGMQLISDGFDIHCPNVNCGLTLEARFRRLGETQFFDFESLNSNVEMIFNDDDYQQYCRPFSVITQGFFWGAPGGSLENILLRLTDGKQSVYNPPHHDAPSLATFLIPDFLEGFLENPAIPNTLSAPAVKSIRHFYGWMTEIINRRDAESPTQNKVLASFLWSLGIESLRPETIYQMFVYEHQTGAEDPLVVYAYLLTNVGVLANEVGLHPLEAAGIVGEVKRRAYELHDIFYYYAQNKDDITNLFKQIM